MATPPFKPVGKLFDWWPSLDLIPYFKLKPRLMQYMWNIIEDLKGDGFLHNTLLLHFGTTPECDFTMSVYIRFGLLHNPTDRPHRFLRYLYKFIYFLPTSHVLWRTSSCSLHYSKKGTYHRSVCRQHCINTVKSCLCNVLPSHQLFTWNATNKVKCGFIKSTVLKGGCAL